MIDILIGAVIILSVFIGVLFVVIGDLKKEIKEVVNSQHVQDEEIYELMKSQYQHSEIITYLTDQDPLLGKNKKMIYPTIIGEA